MINVVKTNYSERHTGINHTPIDWYGIRTVYVPVLKIWGA